MPRTGRWILTRPGNRSIHNTQLLGHRGPAGWSTQNITTPHEEISEIIVGSPSEYLFFSEGLSAGVVDPVGATPLSSQTTEPTPYRREASGEYTPLVTAGNVLPGVKFGGRNSSPAITSTAMASNSRLPARTPATSSSPRRSL